MLGAVIAMTSLPTLGQDCTHDDDCECQKQIIWEKTFGVISKVNSSLVECIVQTGQLCLFVAFRKAIQDFIDAISQVTARLSLDQVR